MRSKIKYTIICAILIILVFTSKSKASTGKVTTETLNLRSEASTNSSVIALLNSGEEVDIISEEGNWYKVKYKDKEGYVSKDYIKEDENVEEKPENTALVEPTPTTTEEPVTSNIESNENMKLNKDVEIKILPLINSNTIGSAKKGEEVTAITQANNWIFIQTDEIAGWIVKDMSVGQATKEDELTTPESNDNNDKENSGENNNVNNEVENKNSNETNYSNKVTKYINATSVYMRSEPSTSADIITSLIKNTDVTVTGESGDWYKVEFNNHSGYIYKSLLSDNKIEETNRSTSNRDIEKISNTNVNISSKGEQIVEYAKQYLGCPYVYGAAGDQSFDCSGFTMYVYKNFGYSLCHSATAQSKMGEYVAKEDLQPGDLVFFLDYETMDGIGHCGIYIGDGNFIHASSGSGYCVKISTLLSGSYYNRYATARRLI